MRLTLLVLAGALLALPVQAAEYYKWVDQNGVVQYSRTPPKDQQAQTVKADSKPARVDPAAAAAQAAGEPQTEVEKARALLRKDLCDRASENLAALRRSNERVLTRKDPATGVEKALTDEQIASERDIAERQVAQYCGPEQK